jgi:uncharacterized membrane protein
MSDPVERIDPARSGLDRLAAFSDGVFAIAITVLVLPLTEIDVTGDVLATLHEERGQILAFVISFAVIGRYWIGHHDDVKRMIGVDRHILVWNLVFLFFVVVLPFPSAVLGQGTGVTPTILYASTIILTALSQLALWLAAHRRGLTDPTVGHRYTVQKTGGTLGVVVGFLPSFVLAFAVPGLAQWSWLLVLPFSWLFDRIAARRLTARPT